MEAASTAAVGGGFHGGGFGGGFRGGGFSGGGGFRSAAIGGGGFRSAARSEAAVSAAPVSIMGSATTGVDLRSVPLQSDLGYPYADYGDYDYGYPYYDYGYDDFYYGDGGCYVVQRRVHTRYGWRIRPVQVCV